jgi:mono/diheme cytochrome c family protein
MVTSSKLTIALASFAFIGFSISSCKKTNITTKTAFTHSTMKPLFDSYCASCHASGKSDSGRWLYDPSDYTGSIQASISSIYNSVYINKTMPVGLKLSSSELNSFKSWYDAGYPAK